MHADHDTPLYAVRQVGDRWTVYVWRTLDPVVVRGVPQVGLEQDVARAIADFLTEAEGKPERRTGRNDVQPLRWAA